MAIKVKKENRFLFFIKRFWVYIIAGLLAIGIGVTLGVAAAASQKQSVVDVVKPGNDGENETQKDPVPTDQDNNQENGDNESGGDEDNSSQKDDQTPASTQPVSFALPMSEASVLVDFSDTKLVYNPTLDRWESHFYVDLTSNDLSVYSILDGTVASVSYDYLTGYVVKIAHDDGFVSVYASLGDDVAVKEGDKVTKGQKIGSASSLAASSSAYGNHLEFTLLQNDKKIDPNNYLDLQNK